MAAIDSETLTGGLLADAICDQALFEAGRTPRWQPPVEVLPERVRRLGDEVLEFVGQPELDTAQSIKATALGREVAFYAHELYENYASAIFRAHSAIIENAGNCISRQEVVSGTLAVLGYSSQSYAAWSESSDNFTYVAHAENGILVGDTLVKINGSNGAVSKSDDEILRAAAKEALTGEPSAVIVNQDVRTRESIDAAPAVPLDQLHIVDMRTRVTGVTRKLVIPASAAVLMFTARGAVDATKDGFKKYEDTAASLSNYAAVL